MSSQDKQTGFTLDPREIQSLKAKRAHYFNTYQVPLLRAIGFLMVSFILLAWNLVNAEVFDLSSYLNLMTVVVAYILISWWLLHRFYGKTGKIDLGFVFLNVDILLFLLLLAHTTGDYLWMALLLLARVADQSNISFRRAYYFTHIIVLAYLLFLVYLALD